MNGCQWVALRSKFYFAVSTILLAFAICGLEFQTASAQIASGGGRPFVTSITPIIGPSGSVVGGISIDADGVVSRVEIESAGPARQSPLGQMLPSTLTSAPNGHAVAPTNHLANQASQLRKISLRKLELEIVRLSKANLPLPSDVEYLAGLQRISFVFVDQQNNDIILAGPAEGWNGDSNGFVTGNTTGLPAIHLCDLVTALRTARDDSVNGMTCSMDATEQGLENYSRYLRRGNLQANEQTLNEMREAIGHFEVTFTGIQDNSHFARTLIAADLLMKRIGMHLEASPVEGVTSYIEMLQQSNRAVRQNTSPRWWLATDYEPLLRDEQGLVWNIRGPGVKAMTDDDLLTRNGEKVATGRANPLAQRWADNFTAKFPELSIELPVFGQLRNCFDLVVVAAMLNQYELFKKAGFEPTVLLDSEKMPLAQYDVPRFTEPQISYAQSRQGWIVTLSGGIDIDGWSIAQNTQFHADLQGFGQQAIDSSGEAWWWD